jgi:hypothetical protein
MIAAAPQAVAPPPQAPAPNVAPPAAPEQAADPETALWDKAQHGGDRDAVLAYLTAYPSGAHLQEAQLLLANLILGAPATGTAFDGAWQTTWTCPNLGQYPGYSYRYEGTVKNGVYHGARGEKGQPSSMVLDGRIDADGHAAFFGDVIVGSSLVGLGAARGSESDFHALAHFSGDSGGGKRIEGRGCTLSFARG